MADYGMLRSDYLKIMMGDGNETTVPYRPDQINDLGDTSFDTAALESGADMINGGADLPTSVRIIRQSAARKKREEQDEAYRQYQLEQQRQMVESQQEDGKGEWWQQVFGFIDNIAASWGTGWVKFYEGILDLGAGIVSTIASWAGNQAMSDDINNWIEKDLAGNAAEWTKTFANFTPWAVISNIANGNYASGEYWGNAFKSGIDVLTLENTNLRETEDLASTLKGDTAKYYDFHSGYNTEFGEFLGGVVQSIGTVMASIYGFPNIAGFKDAFGGRGEGASLANKAVNLIPFSASASGSGMEEALNDGAERTDLALAYGLASGAVEGATELASVGLEKIPGIGKLFTGEIHGLASKGVSLTTSKFLANMFEEGFEEVESDLLNPLIKTIYKGSSALDEYGSGEYWLNLGKDFAAGAVSAGIMGAAGNVQSKYSEYKNRQAESEIVSKIKERFSLSSDEAARAVLANAAFGKAASQLAIEYEEAYRANDAARMKEVQKQVEELSKAMESTLNGERITDEDRRKINLKFTLNLQTFAEDISAIASGVKTYDTDLPAFEDKTLAAKGTAEAPASLIKEAANSREGEVFDFSSVNRTYKSVKSLLENALERAGIKAKSMTKARNFVKNIFDAVNLGTDADKAAIKNYFKNNILDMDVRIEEADGTKRTASLESVTTEDMRNQIAQWADDAFDEMMTKGKTSTVTKLINKIQTLIQDHLETKSKGRLHKLIKNHAARLVEAYGHANAWINQSGEYDFDHKGYQVLVAPFGQLKETDNGLSFTGKDTLSAFDAFLENYKVDNYTSAVGGLSAVTASDLWNQGLRDLAIMLTESIERNNRYEVNVLDDAGNPTGETMVRYRQLDSAQLDLLNQMLDIVRDMPKTSMETRLKSRTSAMSAKAGVESYVTNTPGHIRTLLQGYAERFASQTDTIMYELGDNSLSKLFYSDLYRNAALRDGAVNEILGGINDYRKEHKITDSKLRRESSVVRDVNGKGIEMRYVETLYRHMLSGEESNNVKYINNDTMYILDKKGKVERVVKVTYSAALLSDIKNELRNRGLLGYSEYLHNIDNDTLKDVYDEDYLRDFHIANSNSLDNYTQIVLKSNSKEIGKAEVIGGVSNKNYQIDRVKTIPKGTHLVLVDGATSILANAKSIYNTHFLDPVMKEINASLNAVTDGSHGKGQTVRQYLVEHKMDGAMTLMQRMLYGAYDVTPSELKKHPLLDGFSTNWTMYVLGLNPSTILKQPVSIMWSNDIKLSSVLRFTVASNLLTGRVFNNTNRLVREIEAEFPSLKLRKSQNQAIVGNTPKETLGKIQNNVAKVVGFGINWTDRWTVAHEAVGLLAYQGKSLGYGDIGTESNDQYVKDHYVSFYQTQVSSNKITMSGARAGYYGSLGTFFSLFTGPAQGQVGYLLRAGQQIQQFKGKTAYYYETELNGAISRENAARLVYEDKANDFKTISEAIGSTSDEIKQARMEMDDAFDAYAAAKGARENIEVQKKSFRHYQDLGGAKAVVANRLGSALTTGVYLSLLSLLIKMLKGKHDWKWEDGDAQMLAQETAINSFASWVPVLRNFIDMAKGYEPEAREYIGIKQIYTVVSSIAGVIKDMADGNLSESSTKELMRTLINSFGMVTGIPTENIYSYVYGILKKASPEASLVMRNLFYGVSNSSLASDIKSYAEANDISSASKYMVYQSQMYKTGGLDHDTAVELSKLMKEGFNPVAKNIPDYYEGEDGEKVTLTDDQRAKFKSQYSKSDKVVVKLIKSAKYKSMTSEAKAKHIKKVYDLYYELAKHEALNIEPDSRLGKLLAFTGGEYDIANTLFLIQQNSELMDNRRLTKKEQAVRLVNRQAMSRPQKLLTLYLMGYGVSSENKKIVQNYLISLGFSKKQAEEFLPSNK